MGLHVHAFGRFDSISRSDDPLRQTFGGMEKDYDEVIDAQIT